MMPYGIKVKEHSRRTFPLFTEHTSYIRLYVCTLDSFIDKMWTPNITENLILTFSNDVRIKNVGISLLKNIKASGDLRS